MTRQKIFSIKGRHTILMSILFICFYKNGQSQLPVIQSVGGDGRNVNWGLQKKTADPEGPGYFYHDCDQGVEPTKASSTLPNQGAYNYRIKNINDEDPMTAWVEGQQGYGIGEYFEIRTAGVNVIYNGYQSSPKSWIENSRVKRFKVFKNNNPICYLDLTDEMGRQIFELPGHQNYNPQTVYTFRFEIVEVYEGTKWKDVAISEIDLALCCVAGDTKIGGDSKASSISEIKNGQTVLGLNEITGEFNPTEVVKINKQKHLSLLRVTCQERHIDITPNHPLYIKGYGFSSITNYMKTHQLQRYDDLINNIEFMIWNENTLKTEFVKLTAIDMINGLVETFSINQIKEGHAYIANGFVTKTY